MPILDSLLNKIQLSDVNHELGKVKENFVTETASYVGNFRSDAAAVGSFLQSKSSQLGHLFVSGVGAKSQLRKSTSLPVNLAQQLGTFAPASSSSSGAAASSSSANQKPSISASTNQKYKYKSTTSPPPPIAEEEEERRITSEIGETIVAKFIRVVESGSSSTETSGGGRGGNGLRKKPHHRLSSREEIRRRLAVGLTGGADGGEGDQALQQRSNGYRRGFQSSANSDLQICFINEFINETASDEEEANGGGGADAKDVDHDDGDAASGEDGSDSEPEQEPAVFPRSRSEWDAFRNPDLLAHETSSHETVTHAEERRLKKFRRKQLKLQRAAQTALSTCEKQARRKSFVERQKRKLDNPLKCIAGIEPENLSNESLSHLNVATLQVIVNAYLTKIEQYNEELVQFLLEKDDLQHEQESIIVDIEDLSESLK